MRKNNKPDLTGLHSEIDSLLTANANSSKSYESFLTADPLQPTQLLPPTPTLPVDSVVTPESLDKTGYGESTKMNIRLATLTQMRLMHIRLNYSLSRKMLFLDMIDYIITEARNEDAFTRMVDHFKQQTP